MKDNTRSAFPCPIGPLGPSPLPLDSWYLCPYPLALAVPNRVLATMILVVWTYNLLIYVSVTVLPLMPPLPVWVLTGRPVYQDQDISISTFWWSLSSRHLRPCDVTTAGLLPWCCDIQAVRANNPVRMSWVQQRALIALSDNCWLFCMEGFSPANNNYLHWQLVNNTDHLFGTEQSSAEKTSWQPNAAVKL